MTIICAYHRPGAGTWIGSDTQYVYSGAKIFAQPKWTTMKGKAIATTGSFLSCNAIHNNVYDILGADIGVHKAVRVLRQLLLSDYGFKKYGAQDSDGDLMSIQIMYATPREVYISPEDGSVFPLPPKTYFAYGSGGLFAMGAAHALFKNTALSTGDAFRQSIETAIALDVNCGGSVYSQILFDESQEC